MTAPGWPDGGPPSAPIVGLLCRCVRCCCSPGKGHNHPDWIAWEQAQRAREDEDRD